MKENSNPEPVFAQHLIRWGLFAHVGRFTSPQGIRFPRGTRVVCRTSRGLEIGQVLLPDCEAADPAVDGTVLRRVSVADELLAERLDRHKEAALRSCQQRLRERALSVQLLDVEQLLDGSLYFHFLGAESPELERLLSELTEVYDSAVQFTRFAQTLTAGCGPGCGTPEAAGQGCTTGGCASCAVGCGTKRRPA